MTAKVAMTARESDLVVPLAHEATAMRTTDTARSSEAASGAVSQLSDRRGDVDSTKGRSTRPTTTMPGARTSTTATRTTTTRTTSCSSASSADESSSHAEFSFSDVVIAHLDCRRHKRNTAACQAFEQDLATNLWTVFEALDTRTYRPGRSKCFIITWPKVREVIAAPYVDRVVHHLWCLKIGERFTRTFIADSYACIPERGTLYAADRLESKVRSITRNWKRPAFYLKCDIKSFFPSIDKNILHGLLAPRIPEPFWLWLTETMLFHDPRNDVDINATPAELALVDPKKSLFNNPAHRGLAIGNLISQVFANIYLDVLDQHAKHDLHCRYYGRYVDDFYVLDESPEWLNFVRADIEAFLPARLGLQLHPKKTVLQPLDRGIDFVGQVLKPHHRRIRKRTKNASLQRLATMPDDGLYEAANSYFGLHRQASHSHGDRADIARLLLARGFAVNKAFTKTFRKSQ